MTLTTEEQVKEFRAGTVNDLLVAAKGGTTPATEDAKRFKSLAMAGGIASGLLAIALVVVLIKGTGGSGGANTQANPGSTTVTMANPPKGQTYNLTIYPSQGVSDTGIPAGGTITLIGQSTGDSPTPVRLNNLLIEKVKTKMKAATPIAPASVFYEVTVFLSSDTDVTAIGSLDTKPQNLKAFVTPPK